MRIYRVARGLGAALALIASRAHAGNSLTVSDPTLDPPTLVTLGVQMLVNGDDNFNATVTVRYKKSSDTTFKSGMPLFRVHPEQVQTSAPPPQFAGSIFDLEPDTSTVRVQYSADSAGTASYRAAVRSLSTYPRS